MWFVRRVVVVGSAVLLSIGCSDDADDGVTCTLPEEPEFEITGTILQANASHESCPEEVPAGLSSEQLEDEGICERDVSDCAINLDCEVNGFTVQGKLGERDGDLIGRVEVTKPIQCVYEVTGKFR